MARRERESEYNRTYYVKHRAAIAEQNRRYQAANAPALRAYKQAYYARNREARRDDRMFKEHGLRPEDWARMWADQDGKCYLCGEELSSLSRKEIHVDHDHSCCGPLTSCTVCNRGLACNSCNNALGRVRDDPARLRRVADALETAQLAVIARRACVRAHEQLTLELEG